MKEFFFFFFVSIRSVLISNQTIPMWERMKRKEKKKTERQCKHNNKSSEITKNNNKKRTFFLRALIKMVICRQLEVINRKKNKEKKCGHYFCKSIDALLVEKQKFFFMIILFYLWVWSLVFSIRFNASMYGDFDLVKEWIVCVILLHPSSAIVNCFESNRAINLFMCIYSKVQRLNDSFPKSFSILYLHQNHFKHFVVVFQKNFKQTPISNIDLFFVNRFD